MKWECREGVDFYLDDEGKVLAIILKTFDEMFPYTYIYIDSGENDACRLRHIAMQIVERTYRNCDGLCLASIRNAKKDILV